MKLNFKLSKQQYIFYSLVLFFFSVYTIQVFLNHYFLRTNALDYGFYNQAFWDFAHFRMSKSTIFQPNLSNYFQIHQAYTIPILSPLYWIFNWIFGTYTLLFIQNLFIITGGIYTYKLIDKKTDNKVIALLAFVHYNIIWGHFSALSFEYIDATVAASMVPVFIYLFCEKKFIPATLVFFFITVSKENMPIWFIFIIITLFITQKPDKKQKIYGISYIVASIIILVIYFSLLIPYFEDPSYPYWGFAYSYFGDTFGEAVKYCLIHPFETIQAMFINHTNPEIHSDSKMEFYYVFLLSGGILIFLNPKYLVWFLPVIAQKMLNDSLVRWGINTFYSIEIVSILTISSFLSIQLIKHKLLKITIIVILCCTTLITTLIKMDHRKSEWYDKTKEQIYKRHFYKGKYNAPEVLSLINNYVPKDAFVCTSSKLVPHLAYRSKITLIPYVMNSEYIIILKDSSPYPLFPDQLKEFINEYKNNSEWDIIYNSYPVLIFKKNI